MNSAIPEPHATELKALPCRGTFEAHITVDVGVGRRDAFVALCEELGVKCVLIELAVGRTASQPMTASYHRGDLASVLEAVERIHAGLERGGFPVVRVKLEAVATNVGVPVTDEEARAIAGAYFEFHAKVRMRDDADLAPLRDLCVRHGAHLSRNDRRRDARDGTKDRFATLRVYGAGRERATAAFESLLGALREAGYTIVGVKREFTVYDSRASLDAGWLDPPPSPEGSR